MVTSGRLSTNIYETDEEYAMKLYSFLNIHGATNLDGAIISSVVPALIGTLKKAIKLVCGVDALVVGPGIKTGLSIKIDDPAQLGADLVVGAVAAKAKYPCPIIIFDLGTATTGSVIDKNGNFLGGIITTGVKTSINALSSGTALLPQIDITAPKKVIGTNSIESMKSGCVVGTAAMLDGFVDRFQEELGEEATIVVTGGLGKSIAKICKHKMITDENLIIDGLKIIYNKNSEEYGEERMDLSLVIPCYNEEGNVKKFFEEAEKQFGHRGITYEYVFINDGSNDNTGRVLKELFDTKTENNISIINFSRNFGKESAIFAGLKNADGDYICVIDADLQQHPVSYTQSDAADE